VALSREILRERDREDVALGREGLGQPAVAGGQVKGRGLGLTVAGGQICPKVSGSHDRILQLGEQRPRVPLAAVPAVGPDALELGGLCVEPAERPAGDGVAMEKSDEHAAARRRELIGRVLTQPSADRVDRAAVAGGVLDGEFGEQRLGQRVVLADRDEAQVVHGRCGHHLTV
jgi:hypothetical protein